MKKKEKKITVIIKNRQLNALEDLLYSEINEENAKLEEDVKNLWKLLVKAYDKK